MDVMSGRADIVGTGLALPLSPQVVKKSSLDRVLVLELPDKNPTQAIASLSISKGLARTMSAPLDLSDSEDAIMARMILVPALKGIPYGSGADYTEHVKKLLSQGRLANMNGNVILFVSSASGWCLLDSYESTSFLSAEMKTGASVNYDIATKALRAHIKGTRLPTYVTARTACLSRRYNISETKTSFDLEEVVMDIRGDPGRELDRSMCTSGIKCAYHCPSMTKDWILTRSRGAIGTWLSRTFGDSLSTIMWIVGNTIVEPCSDNYLVLVVGESMSGKSTALRIIGEVFKDRMTALPSSYIVGSRILVASEVEKYTSARILLSQDLEFVESVGLNIANIKMITGGDIITGNSGEAITMSKTVIATCNVLPCPELTSAWCQPQHSRRVLAVMALSRLGQSDGKSNLPVPHFTEQDVSSFAYRCVLERLSFDNIPLSIRDLFMVLFLGRGEKLLTLFRRKEDVRPEDSYLATISLARITEITYESLILSVKAITPYYICSLNGVEYIKLLCLVEKVDTDKLHPLLESDQNEVVWRNSSRSANASYHNRSG